MRKIVFTNDKGGVGKTTTVANLAVGLARGGYRTLVVDMDPQGDVTYALLGARPPLATKDRPLPHTMYGLLLEKYDVNDVVISAPRYSDLDVLPSNSDLAAAALQMANNPGSQTVLFQALRTLACDAYQFVLLDTGKGLDLLVINALAAADEVMVMVAPGRLELDAIDRVITNVDRVRERTLLGAERPRVTGIILTTADHHTVTQDTKSAISEKYPGLLLHTTIPKNDDLKKAISRAISIFEFQPRSRGAQAYELLLKEILNHEEQ